MGTELLPSLPTLPPSAARVAGARLSQRIASVPLFFSGQILHTRNRKSEIPLESTSANPLDIFLKTHWKSDNPLENTAEQSKDVGKCH